eukprot:g3767.t1
MKARRGRSAFASAGSASLLSRAPSSESVRAGKAPVSLPLPSASSSSSAQRGIPHGSANELNALRRNVASLTSVSRKDARTIAGLQKDLEEATNRVREAEAYTARAVADALAEAAKASNPETDPYEARMQVLTRQVSKLQSELNAARASDTEMRAKQRHLEDALKRATEAAASSDEGDATKTRRQLQAVSAHAKALMNKNADLEKQLRAISHSKTEMSELKARLDSSDAAHRSVLGELEALKKKFASTSAEASRLRTELEHCETRRRNLSSDLARTCAESLQLKSEIKKRDKRAQESQAQIDSYKEQVAGHDRLKRDLAEAKVTEAKRDSTISSLRMKLDRMEDLMEENNVLKGRLQEQDLARVQGERQRRSLTEALTKYKSAVEELHPQALLAKELKQKVDALNLEIKQMVEMQGTDVLKLKGEMSELQQALEKQKEYMGFFTQQRMRMDDLEMRDAEATKNVAEAQEIARVYTERVRMLEKELKLMEQVAEQDAARDAANAEKITRLQVDLAAAMKRERVLKNAAAKAAGQNDARQEKIDNLQEEVDSLRAESLNMAGTTKNLRAKLDDLEPKLLELRAQLGAKQAELAATNEKCTNLSLELKEAKASTMRARRKSVIEMAKKSSTVAAKVREALRATETELRATVSKLVAAEEASESAFTCLACMEIMKRPVTCIPCGHSFCEACLTGVPSFGEKNAAGKAQGGSIVSCPECSSSGSGLPPPPATEYHIENQLLENLTARYVFRKQAMGGLKGVMKQLQEKMNAMN